MAARRVGCDTRPSGTVRHLRRGGGEKMTNDSFVMSRQEQTLPRISSMMVVAGLFSAMQKDADRVYGAELATTNYKK